MELSPSFFLCWFLIGACLDYGDTTPSSTSPFVSGKTADSILQRRRRANTGVLEEVWEGDLERECYEEPCDLEEAREIFEDDEKTMAFWMGYIDGNQCNSSPCVNQGSCKDQLGSYSCTCQFGYTGRNCEIIIAKRCDVNNGDCMHFCELLGTFGAKCACATGYRLMEDGLNCEPEVEYPCGRTALADVSGTSIRSLFSQGNSSLHDNVTSVNDSYSTTPLPFTSATTTTTTTTTIGATTTAAAPPPLKSDSAENNSVLKGAVARPVKTLQTQLVRIVGGEVVIPGEIPWQAALVKRSSGEIFCGGSILSERWVITAAHCLVEAQLGSYYIRVGEVSIDISEHSEQNLEVSEERMHPHYDTTKSLYNHDIALIHLKSPIVFSTTVRPVCVGPRDFTEFLVREHSPATVSGWGRTRFLGATSNSLQKVKVPFTSRTECKRTSSARITRFMFCAGYSREAKDACQGDSGGPHVNVIHDTWFLTGIVSWGEECAKEGKYGVYTRVAQYYRWIHHVIGSSEQAMLESDMDVPDDEDDE